MNERTRRKIQNQQNIISRQSEQIAGYKAEIEKLKLQLEEKNKLVNSITPLREELKQSVAEVQKQKKEYQKLIDALKEMKKITNQTVFKNRWWLIKYLIK